MQVYKILEHYIHFACYITAVLIKKKNNTKVPAELLSHGK